MTVATSVFAACGGGGSDSAVPAIGTVNPGDNVTVGTGNDTVAPPVAGVPAAGTPETGTDTTPVTGGVAVILPGTTIPVPSDNTGTTTVAQRISNALLSASPGGLQKDDAGTLLDQAIAQATQQRVTALATMNAIYGAAGEVSNLALNIGTGSASIEVLASTTAVPYIVADSGAGIAAVTNSGAGRGMAYGGDVLQWMAGTTKEQQHYPQFLRAFTWQMTGSGNGTLPSTIKYATSGYTTAYVKNFITRTGKTAAAVDCAVADSNNTCWTNLDLIVFGGSVPASSGLTALVKKYLAGGKAVIYMHPGWSQSGGGSQVLAAMGMKLGGYPGNYFAGTSAVSVAATRTLAQSLTAADRLGALIASLNLLKQSALTLNLASDTTPVKPFTTMLNEFAALNNQGTDIFAGESSYLMHRLLVLWADLQRPSINYGSVSRAAAVPFLRTYASDSFLWFARGATTTALGGQGDYMPAAAQTLTPGSDWEQIDVTLSQASGITLIGRGAVPGKGLQIEVLDGAGTSSLGIQTSYLRSWGDPLTDSGDTYARPLRPHSFTVPLGSGTRQFVAQNGGPLMLSYAGATPHTVVKLRVKGGIKYAHFDFTRTMSDSDVAAASAALKSDTFGWQTTKVVGGEIQQISKYAKSVIGNVEPQVYANIDIRDGLFLSNHIANGYNDAGMTTKVSALCSELSWTCDGVVHNEPSVQHFVGWIATCGFLCSGNPIDGSAGIGLGWGYSHELGHNTVQRVMHIAPDGEHGCLVECDNNILASATAMRVYDLYNREISSGHPLDHPGLYAAIVKNRATGLSDDALVSNMEQLIWTDSGQNIQRAVHFQLAFLFTKYRSGLAVPSAATAMDFFSLLTKGDRLVAKNFSVATAANYGMGRYPNNTITNHDLLYVLSSKIIGRDLRKTFWMVGIPLSANALGSIADLGLPIAPRNFYALGAGKHNQIASGKWVDLESTTPAYP